MVLVVRGFFNFWGLIMLNLAILGLCINFQFIYHVEEELGRDERIQSRAVVVCQERYNSCVSKIVKVKWDTYRVFCK